jgi:hypothetical protein
METDRKPANREYGDFTLPRGVALAEVVRFVLERQIRLG